MGPSCRRLLASVACCLLAPSRTFGQCEAFDTLPPSGDPIPTYGGAIAVWDE